MQWLNEPPVFSGICREGQGFDAFCSSRGGEKLVVLNACFGDGTAGGQLAIQFASELWALAVQLSERAGAGLEAAAFRGSEAAAALERACPGGARLVQTDELAILAEPEALCGFLTYQSAVTLPERTVAGRPAYFVTPQELLSIASAAPQLVVALPGRGLYTAGCRTSWGELSTLWGGEIRFLAVGGPAHRLVFPDQFDRPVAETPGVDSPLFDGTVVPVGQEVCPVGWLARAADQARRTSCGKCVLCRLGTKQIALTAAAVTEGEAGMEELENIPYVAGGMHSGASCPFGRSFGEMTWAFFDAFREEFAQHIRRKKCAALTCRGYYTYHVLPKLCVGCCACQTACPKGALLGGSREIHVVDQFLCNKCGACAAACPQDAVTKAGVLKPKTPKEPVPVGSWKW